MRTPLGGMAKVTGIGGGIAKVYSLYLIWPWLSIFTA